MNPPQSIPYSAIDLGTRARTEHLNIDTLADAIEDVGLIEPVILVEKTPELVAEYEAEFRIALDPTKPYLLTAGGRRMFALEQLDTEFLYHAATSEPGRPGFLLRGEQDLLSQLIIECQENLNREDMDWRDQLKAMVRAWRLAQRKAHENGEAISQRMFGVTLGVSYQTLEAGDRIYNHFMANPKLYEGIVSIRGALPVLLKAQANEVTRIAVAKSFAKPIESVTSLAVQALPDVSAHVGHQPNGDIIQKVSNPDLPGESVTMQEAAKEHVISLSQAFRNCDSLTFMAENKAFCDHIICDPDYAIGGDVLDAHPNNRHGIMAEGIRQSSPDESLRQLFKFLELSFYSLRDHGFLIFWYAIDHHEKLQAAASNIGFAVQPWPNIWNKMDFRGRSNAAPNHNFPKSVEFAMVCRKSGTILRKVQTSCVYTTTGNAVTKELGHAFAKPYDVWRWLYSAVSVPGQIVFDPFVGTGSSAIAAVSYGLRPIGCELDPNLYGSLIINMQNHYRKLLGPHVKFT